MFASPAPAAPALSPITSSASTAAPSRTGRLRGLSALRTYTQNHFSSPSQEARQRPSFTRSLSTPTGGTDSPDSSRGGLRLRGGQNSEQSATGTSRSRRQQERTTNPCGIEESSAEGVLPIAERLSGSDRVAAEASTTTYSSPVDLARGQRDPDSEMARHNSSTAPQRAATAALGSGSEVNAAATDTNRIDASTDEQSEALENALGRSTTHDGLTSSPSMPQQPTIRFVPHNDPRAARPSLQFAPVQRTLPSSTSTIRVGRYSERDSQPEILPSSTSAAPVGFKSKVVSRRHCEFWCSNSQWYIKDVKSSSGTFLNHIRLSQPGVESRPWPVNDGDVVQLGIDFRGGEEQIFRCVKIRIEANRGWQKGLNKFKCDGNSRRDFELQS